MIQNNIYLKSEQKLVVNRTMDFVKNKLQAESTGHDWLHAYRVWKNSIKICQKEQADMFVVQIAALLHDISDWKFNNVETA